MGNDAGTGGRSSEPPELATVRRLHLDDTAGSTATATEEWYETERLTGHITGGARSTPPVDPPPPAQDGTPVVLDWRHGPAVSRPTALKRLGRTFAGRRRGPQDSEVPSSVRTRGARPAVLAAASQIEQPIVEPGEDEPAVEEIRPAAPGAPRIALRESGDRTPQRSKRRYAATAGTRGHGTHPRLRAALIVTAIVLGVAAMGVIAIVSDTNSAVTKPPGTGLVAVTSRPGEGLSTVAKNAVGVLGALGHQLRKSQPVPGAVHAHGRHRRTTGGRVRRSSRDTPATGSESAPRIADAASTRSASSYSSSGSSSGYGSHPATTEPAPATASTKQPAAFVTSASHRGSSATASGPPAPGGPPAP
jgi:hypothetical protein